MTFIRNLFIINYLFGLYVVTLMISGSCKPDSDMRQGIRGKVLWVEVNPTAKTVTSEQITKVPVQKEIYIYDLSRITDAGFNQGVFFEDMTTNLITVVRSDPSGMFEVQLDEGKYSVFVREDVGLYASKIDEEGYILPVEVEKGKITEIEIEVDFFTIY